MTDERVWRRRHEAKLKGRLPKQNLHVTRARLVEQQGHHAVRLAEWVELDDVHSVVGQVDRQNAKSTTNSTRRPAVTVPVVTALLWSLVWVGLS